MTVLFDLAKRSSLSWTLLWGLAVLVACSRQSKERPTPNAGPVRGDWLIVEQTAGEFFKGRVLSVTGSQLKLQRVMDGAVLDVGESDTYRLPETPARLPAAAYGVCELAKDVWKSCRVVRVADNGWLVADTAGVEFQISALQLLEPTSLTAMNIRYRFDEAARRSGFEKSVSEAGQPRRPSGWTVSPERLVLAERDGKWIGAKVVEADDERVVVRWDGQAETAALALRAVAPQPPACGASVRGDRALLRPAGHGAPWVAVLVVAVDGTEATVEDIDRSRVSVQQRDLCPLGEAKSLPKL